jgi:hypothetical protein
MTESVPKPLARSYHPLWASAILGLLTPLAASGLGLLLGKTEVTLLGMIVFPLAAGHWLARSGISGWEIISYGGGLGGWVGFGVLLASGGTNEARSGASLAAAGVMLVVFVFGCLVQLPEKTSDENAQVDDRASLPDGIDRRLG